MKEKRHHICAGCLAYQKMGFPPYGETTWCELGYRITSKHTGMNTFMDGPRGMCLRPCQRRTLEQARGILLASGRRIEAHHVNSKDAPSILVMPLARPGADYPDFYRKTSLKTSPK